MSNKNHQRNLPVPFFSQRENKYVWQQVDIQNNPIPNTKVSPAWMSCNITSLCMILHYFGITNETPDEMMRKFFDANNYRFRKEPYVGDGGPNRLQDSELLKEFTKKRYESELNGADINITPLSLRQIQDEIAKGYPVYASFGSLSKQKTKATEESGKGHIVVIRGFTENDDIIINDPWGDPVDPSGSIAPLLKTDEGEVLSFYMSISSGDEYGKNYGFGTGDNCVMRRESFIYLTRSRDESKSLYNTLVIRYPHYWSFPVRGAAGKELRANSVSGNNDAAGQEDQKKIMLEMLDYEDGSFPVGNMGAWKGGVDIKGQAGKSVYAIGPGRLIAARTTPPAGERNLVIPSPYFALVCHSLTDGNEAKHFFSYYYHLSPVDISARMKARFSGQVDGTREKDWIDQLIDHVMPKRAMVYVRGAKELDGKINEEMPKIYEEKGSVMKETGQKLGDRSLVYLYPVDAGLKTLIEEISPNDNEHTLLDLFKKINDISKYVRKVGNDEYYGFYYNIPGNTTSDFYIKKTEAASKIMPQRLNIQEYAHYRRKISALLRGEAVTFLGEDPTAVNQAKQASRSAKKPEELLAEKAIEVFWEEGFASMRGQINKEMQTSDNIKKIKDFYLKRNYLRFFDLYKRFIRLAVEVLNCGSDEVKNPFRVKFANREAWHGEMVKSLAEVFIRKTIEESKGKIININSHDWGKTNSNKEKGYVIVFGETLKLIFSDKIRINEGKYLENYTYIKDYYVSEIEKKGIAVLDEAITNLSYLYRSLLNWVPGLSANKFLLTDKWLTDDRVGLNKTIENLVNQLYGNGKETNKLCEMEMIKSFENELLHMHQLNVDYHLEVNRKTKLGEAGQKSAGKYIVYCSVFSHDRIIADTVSTNDGKQEKFIELRDSVQGPCYNCHEVVKLLKKANIFISSVFKHLGNNTIKIDELRLFYELSFLPLKMIIRIPNILCRVMKRDLSTIANNSPGFSENDKDIGLDREIYNSYAWFTEDEAKEFTKSGIRLHQNGDCYYYHPIEFLFWLSGRKTD
jgi:uncharacterized protein YvpB